MPFHRRNLIQNIGLGAGGLLLTPLLNQLRLQAAGTKKLPQRIVFIIEGNGIPPQQIQPLNIARAKRNEDRNRLIETSLQQAELPNALEPIAPWQNRLSIIQGLSGRVCGGGHSNDFGALGVYNSQITKNPLGETIDVALGKHLGGIFPLITLGITDRAEHNIVYNCSAWEKGKPLPTIVRPDLAYNTLFGSVAGGTAKAEFRAQSNLLDFLRDDLKTLRRQVAGAEAEKLDAHLAAYEALRNRQSRLNEVEVTLRAAAPTVSDKYQSDIEIDRLDAHFDMAAAALIGGLTNVVTLASGVGNPYFSVKFTGLGLDFGKHSIGHGGTYKNWTAEQMYVMIRRYHFELIARLMRKLEAVPEGSGTMLDNTLIVYLSDSAESHHSRCWEWPFVLLGNLGGKLKQGNYVEYPYWGLPGHRQIGNLYTTLLHTVGAPREYFGQPDPLLKHLPHNGPLAELLA